MILIPFQFFYPYFKTTLYGAHYGSSEHTLVFHDVMMAYTMGGDICPELDLRLQLTGSQHANHTYPR